MKSFREYLNEAIVINLTASDYDTVLKRCDAMSNDPIVWRGIQVKSVQGVQKVTNDRDTYRGKGGYGDKNPVRDGVLKRLNIDRPIFAVRDPQSAEFFSGMSKEAVFAILPSTSRIDAFWSTEVADLAIKEGDYRDTKEKGGMRTWSGEYKMDDAKLQKAIDELAASYKKYVPTDNPGRNEIIVQAPEYYIVAPRLLLKSVVKSKFAKIKSIDDVKTYGDLATLIRDYRSYYNWDAKRRAQEYPRAYPDGPNLI